MRSVEVRCGAVLLALLVLASCEKLGLDPSGKLACAQGWPKCPTGLSCLAGRCWRPGTFDGAIEDKPDTFDGALGDKPIQTLDARGLDERSTDGDSNDRTMVDGSQPNGSTCSSAIDCMSGHCVPRQPTDSIKVCCDSACEGSCVDGCTAGTCEFKQFRTSCGEIDSSPYSPRYFICDGDGNCNPPSFDCNGLGNVCAANKNVLCCSDPASGGMLGCVSTATCADQNGGDFEMSCAASIDCPAGTFCCSEQNPDVLVTGCASNCQTFSTHGRDPTQYTHKQFCDLMRDPSCPAGKQCQTDSLTGLGMCGL